MLKKVKIYIYSFFVLIFLTACQTVTSKIDQSTELEKKELSKWLNKSEEVLKDFYGQPDKVEFLETRNRNYVYITKKYKIKCFSHIKFLKNSRDSYGKNSYIKQKMVSLSNEDLAFKKTSSFRWTFVKKFPN